MPRPKFSCAPAELARHSSTKELTVSRIPLNIVSLVVLKAAQGAQAVILKSETYNFHRLDLTRQAGLIVTVYDEDGLKLATTVPFNPGPRRSRKRERSSTIKSRDPSRAGGDDDASEE